MNKIMEKAMKAPPVLPLVLFTATALADPATTLDRASELHRQALALEHGWSVTEPLIAEARAAMDAGNGGQAQALADRALLVAQQSLKQAEDEKSAWQTRVVGR
ncbi:hypothetical protein R0137_01180 [Congregibacter brevis]|uniref:SoxXA-binding protein SoxK n=1 Tax=Congregibacter brevis TaxID=3081201 RepID=A0ABZ0IGP8_9GAMM|nr:hypothetical protein R0137_01180 [Congregibacter sp. IMCC45268]